MEEWNIPPPYIPNSSDLALALPAAMELFPPAGASPAPSASYANSLVSPSSTESSVTVTSERRLSEDLAVAMNLSNYCVNCESNSEISYHCSNCNMSVCYFCASTHKRSLATKDHKLTRFRHRHKTCSISDSLYSSSSRSTATPSPVSSICDIHLEPFAFCCDNCLVPICADCSLTTHNQHQTSPYHKVLETALQNNQRLCKEALSVRGRIERSLQQVHCIADSIDHQMHQAQRDVQQLTRYLQIVLEKKRNEVLMKIQKTRKEKIDRLNAQKNNLKDMRKTAEDASRILANTQHYTNPADIIMANDEVAQALAVLNSYKNHFFPCENDNISFLYDKGGFKELLGISEAGPSGSGATAMLPARRHHQQVAQESVYDKIPSPASDLFVFGQSMPGSRAIYGVVSTIAVRNSFNRTPVCFGSEGGADGQFCRPWGVCCNNLGHLIVVDRSNNRIQVFDASGELLYKFGEHGKGPGEFDRPAGATISPEGNIVVADKDNHRVQVFKMDGTFLFSFGHRGSDDGEFNYPWDVACNIQGDIAVSDTRNHRVQVFTSSGVFMSKFGFDQGMWRHLDSPRGICYTPTGNIAVTDFNNHRVVVIDRTMSRSQHFGHFGHDSRDLLRPQGIVCDDQGRFVVADSRNNRIQIYDFNGKLLGRLGSSQGTFGLDRPSGICLTPEGNVATVDFGNSRVVMY